MSSSLTACDLSALLPDEPRWIDLRGLLLTGRCDLYAEADPGAGLVARSWDFPFAAVAGRPGAALLRSAAAAGRAAAEVRPTAEEWELLAPSASRATVEKALPGWRRRSVFVHRWAGALERPDLAVEAEIALFPDGHRQRLDLAHVPAPTRAELTLDWVSRRPLAAAIVGGLPVAFCYAALTTETLWDVSIETLAPHRRRGLAAACFLALARHMAERGKTPTWGATADNPASLGLAAKLGFVRDSELDGWVAGNSRPPGRRS